MQSQCEFFLFWNVVRDFITILYFKINLFRNGKELSNSGVEWFFYVVNHRINGFDI